jgi:hypothetical protein
MKLDTPLPANTKAGPPLNVGDVFTLIWPRRIERMVERGFENLWSHGDGHFVRIEPRVAHPCGAVECVVVEGRQ